METIFDRLGDTIRIHARILPTRNGNIAFNMLKHVRAERTDPTYKEWKPESW